MYRFYLYHPDLQRPTLIRTPQGWDAATRMRNRDMNLHGIFLNFTEPLNFIKDGKRIIHSLYEKYGVETAIILTIKKFSKITNQFELHYKGKLNLTTFKVNQTMVSCNIENTGFLQQFNNSQTIKYAVSDSGVFDLTLPSIRLLKIINGKANVDTTAIDLPVTGGSVDNYFLFSLADFTAKEIEQFESSYPTQINLTSPISELKWTLKPTEKSVVTLDGDVSIDLELFDHGSFGDLSHETLDVKLFASYGRPGSSFTTVQLGSTLNRRTGISGIETRGHITFSNVSFNMEINDELYIYGKIIWSGPTISDTTLAFEVIPTGVYATYSIKALTTDADSTAKAIPVFEFISNTVAKMTGQQNRFKSNFYGKTENGYAQDGAGSLRAITSGAQIKQQDISLKPIYSQFDQLLKTLKTIDNIGVGYEVDDGIEYIRMEPMDYFYPRTELFRLENVLDIEKSVIASDYSNLFQIGYEKYDYGRLSALDEFNTKREFAPPITQVQKTLTYLSPYIASGYTAELLRRDRLNVSTTKDDQADIGNFIFQLRRDGSGNLIIDRDEDFAEINNLLAGSTMYNLKLSPERLVEAHGSELRAFLDKYQDQEIVQTSSVGNSQMSTRLSTEAAVVSEKANILISSLAKPVYLSEQYTFSYKLTKEQIALMDANPYAYISFRKTPDAPFSRAYILKTQEKGLDDKIEFVGKRANI